MATFIDPCNFSSVSSSMSCVLILICGMQYANVVSQKMGIPMPPGADCLPYLDYLKFVFGFIMAYFTYEVVIKGKKARCGNDGFSMWSSICLSMLLSSAIIMYVCVQYKDIYPCF